MLLKFKHITFLSKREEGAVDKFKKCVPLILNKNYFGNVVYLRIIK